MRRPFYVFSNGRLRRRYNTLYLDRAGDERTPGAEAEDTGTPTTELTGEKVPFPVEQVESLYCFGELDVNAKLVTFLAQHHIPLFFFDYYGNYIASLYPRDYLLSERLKVEQVRHYLFWKQRLPLARAFVRAATYNIMRVLKYYLPRLSEDEGAPLAEALTLIDGERLHLHSLRVLY